MRKRLSLLVALIMAFTIFWIPGQSAFAEKGESDDSTIAALGTVQISFVANGGSGTMSPQSVETGTEVTLNNNSFTWANHTFRGWAKTANGDVVYTDGAKVTISEGMTLYAKWEEDSVEKISVTYYANGGSGAPAKYNGDKGTALKISSTKPTRTGYTFTGWNTKSDGTGTSYAAGASYAGTASLYLYAQWKQITYTVGDLTLSTVYTEQNSIKVKWSLKEGTGKMSKVKVTLRRAYTEKTYDYYLECTQWNTKTFTGLSDGTEYKITVTPYYNGNDGDPVYTWETTDAPVNNGAYKPGKYEYYYVDGVKQRNKTISFKDTRYGTNKYKLWHYYDSDGIFRGRSKAMYNKIKNMSSKKYLIAIDRTNNVMCIYVGGKGNWRPYKYWSCVTGRMKSGNYHPTPLGTYTIKSRKLTFSGYGIPEKLKNRYSVWYCSRFVGSVFIHSQLYKYGSKSSFIPGGRAMGVNASHGCVRLYKSYAYWVYKNCAKGTKVVVMK